MIDFNSFNNLNYFNDSNVMSGALSESVNQYLAYFASLTNQFTEWGQWLFGGLLVINMMWFWLWLAFQKGELDQGLVEFLKKLFMALFFYTLMLHHQWFISVLQTAQVMGTTLTHGSCDPSSIVAEGLAVANKITDTALSFNVFKLSFAMLIIFITYVVTVFSFITIALRLAVLLIETMALILVSSFFLGFAALSSTSKIANNIIDAILANCAKLMGLYLIISAGVQTINHLVNSLPLLNTSFDDYWWLLSTVLLFWAVSKSFPDLLGQIVTLVLSNDRHVDSGGLVSASMRYSGYSKNIIKKLI